MAPDEPVPPDGASATDGPGLDLLRRTSPAACVPARPPPSGSDRPSADVRRSPGDPGSRVGATCGEGDRGDGDGPSRGSAPGIGTPDAPPIRWSFPIHRRTWTAPSTRHSTTTPAINRRPIHRRAIFRGGPDRRLIGPRRHLRTAPDRPGCTHARSSPCLPGGSRAPSTTPSGRTAGPGPSRSTGLPGSRGPACS